MAKILKDLPLFSLIQVSPDLYEKILGKIEEEFPFMMKKVRKTRVETLKRVACETKVVFTEPKKTRSIAVAFSVIDIIANGYNGIITVEITFPQLYGEVAKVREATQKVLCTNGDFIESRSGVALNLTLRDDDTPVLTSQHGNNGNSQKFFATRKETIKH